MLKNVSLIGLHWLLMLVGCQSADQEVKSGPGSADETPSDNTQSDDGRFSAHVFPSSLHNGGYIDSTFINHAGDRVYFLHSIVSPRVITGSTTPDSCSHLQTEALPGHTSAEDLEWNSDLYYVQWDGSVWSEPINLGSNINSLGMECCMWLNDEETEIIFNTLSDLDGDGEDQDLGLRKTGNYRATRPNRDAEWGPAVPMPGEYGTESQGSSFWRNDIEKAPSGNLYLWERTEDGQDLLVFGERTGGTDAEPTYASPVNISGTTSSETQVWVNEAETRLVFNHRDPSMETHLYTRVRNTPADEWGESTEVSTTGFADPMGQNIWGEPSFDGSGDFMIFTRFDTRESACWSSNVLFAEGSVVDGFTAPVVLN
jgi:hypothetical protein